MAAALLACGVSVVFAVNLIVRGTVAAVATAATVAVAVAVTVAVVTGGAGCDDCW